MAATHAALFALPNSLLERSTAAPFPRARRASDATRLNDGRPHRRRPLLPARLRALRSVARDWRPDNRSEEQWRSQVGTRTGAASRSGIREFDRARDKGVGRGPTPNDTCPGGAFTSGASGAQRRGGSTRRSLPRWSCSATTHAHRFRTGCNAMSKPLLRASELSDHAVKPNSSPDPHRGPSNLDPVWTPAQVPRGDRRWPLAGLFCDRGDRI